MSRIRLDYTNVFDDALGAGLGLTDAHIGELESASSVALKRVLARRGKDLRWLDLPYQSEVLDDVLAYAGSVQGRFANVCVLGIGGSALGNRALHTALNSPVHNLAPPPGLPRLFVLDNVDPDLVGEVLGYLDPRETLFNVISKSGGTAETISQLLVVRERLRDALGSMGHVEHLVVTTDAEKGVLRELVRRDGYRSFVVPDGVGGRFSVLSAVGLLSSALVGIDVGGLLQGAAAMDAACRVERLSENPALLYAAIQYLLHSRHGMNVAVTFSYSDRLKDMGDWYAQLLAESLGKRRSRGGEDVYTGPTPVRAVGVTDQHSQVQLYVEGPRDKWFTLLSVDRPDHTIPIPECPEEDEGLAYLGGRTLAELFHAERDGTRIALTEAGRPNATLMLEQIDAHALGQLVYLLELAVAVMGEHYDVDAFDQPGVEAGKLASYALMGRAGHEARRRQIEATASRVAPRVV